MMAISNKFYFRYWLKYSVMATMTGAVIGLFSIRFFVITTAQPFLNIIIGAFIGYIIYQVTTALKFFGKKRGEFEYEYKFSLAHTRANQIVLKNYSLFTYLKFVSDGWNNIQTFQADLLQKMLKNQKITSDKSYLFIIYVKLSLIARKEFSHDKEIHCLESAVAIKPDDLFANFRLAVCNELKKNVAAAIDSYEAALKDPYLETEQLKNYILEQIHRVKTEGPMKNSPELGLKYFLS